MSTEITDEQMTAGAAVLAAYKDLRLNWRNAAIDVFEAMTAAAPVAEPFEWIVAMPDGQHDGGEPFMDEVEANDYIENRAIPGCYLVPLVRANRAASVAELAAVERHTWASIANRMTGQHRDTSGTEYVTLADAEAAVRAAKAAALLPVAERLPHKATMVLATDGSNYALAYQRYDLGETVWYDASDDSSNDVRLDFTPTHWAEVARLAGGAA